ncbi:MAG: hypothetical protein IKT40_01105 [Bacilli bacterium]|nr:hypothetical protein [Bacilli bacterium]
MTKDEQILKSLLALSKNKAEVIIKPLERVISIYKVIIFVLLGLNLLLCGLFAYYIDENHAYNLKNTKTLTYSINKFTKECDNAKRSDVEVD